MPTPSRHTLGDPLEVVTDFLEPFVTPIIQRINVDEFTTTEFIAAMQLDPPTREAYDTAITEYWGHEDPELAKMVLHGQVIPDLLRRSGLVEWMGFAHGTRDAYAVPAWWRKRSEE